jgi:hypothetical protein
MLATLDNSLPHAENIKVLNSAAISSVQLPLSRDVSTIRHDLLHVAALRQAAGVQGDSNYMKHYKAEQDKA